MVVQLFELGGWDASAIVVRHGLRRIALRPCRASAARRRTTNRIEAGASTGGFGVSTEAEMASCLAVEWAQRDSNP